MQDGVDERLVGHALLGRARLDTHQIALGDRDRDAPPLALQRIAGDLLPIGSTLFDIADRNPFAALAAFNEVAFLLGRDLPVLGSPDGWDTSS